jgi:serine/threonine protein kinase/formylglycine-generating enzyme required for sulfatase activity/cephalosporin-C deacetylase-like acetyl esterase
MEMTPEKWEKVKVLFDAALAKPSEQRLHYLQETCAEEDLRAEVVRLLAEFEDAGSFLSKRAPSGPGAVSAPRASGSYPPGQILAGRFKLVRFLARGGMGEVYEAADEELQQRVALKLVRPELLLDSTSLQRFKREVLLAKNVTHANICRTFDLFRHRDPHDSARDVVFVSMELLTGETLSQHLRRRGRLTPSEALPLLTQIAAGMSAAHSVGIVHRDFKPGNVILVRQGTDSLRAVITDFGLALRSRSDTTTLETDITGAHGVVGTPAYMAPEQVEGREVTAATDIYAFGLVLYEMLTGTQPFSGETPLGMAFQRLHEPPPSPRSVVPDLDAKWEAIILRCLERDPAKRFSSANEAVLMLSGPPAAAESASGINLKVLLQQSKRPKVAVPVLLSLLMLVSLSAWWIHHSSRASWARNQAVPQISRLIDEEKLGDAYALAVQAERYIPHDPMLIKFWPKISWSASINTNPPGASVYRKDYKAKDTGWQFVGRTPIEKQRFPETDSLWKFELKGYETVERATFPDAESMTVTMDEEGRSPAGMVHVELASSESETALVRLSGLAGYETLPAIPLRNYWIDKFEVTNAGYKKFVDQGGYQKQQYWKHEFRKAGRVLPWAEGMKLFQDKTGRPGPAGWVQGEYLHGQDEYPVTGVSWFEASAYAEFVGKSLPTIHHWIAAAAPQDAPSVIPASNFGGTGPAPVGEYPGMSWSGAFDMAGNVKEWTLNEADSGKRYLLGGAWNEPSYTFNDPDARSPFDRSANFGFRCAKYVLTGESAKAADGVPYQARDYNLERPVSDQLLRVYKGLYSYDKTPLHANVDSVQQTGDWKEEKISFEAAYGDERITAHLYLPKKASPPFQTVVFFPGTNAFRTRSSDNSRYLQFFDFVLKSGRAVMFPVYKGTFERWDDVIAKPRISSSYRDHTIAWSKDLCRSLDYLETRPDIDRHKLAYEGYSFGAALGALLPAVEDRFKVLVLIAPGFFLNKRLPEADPINFAPRVKAPVLMLNGRFDFIYPPGSSQEPMFHLLGTPKEDKRRLLYDTGHDIPRIEMIKETLSWLDRYLGPVQ